MNVYLDEIPWNGPGVGIPLSVLLAIAPLEGEAQSHQVTFRIVSEDGRTIDETTGHLPAAEPGRQGKAIIEGFVSIDRPGLYTMEVLLDDIPLDDAPRWPLHFVDRK